MKQKRKTPVKRVPIVKTIDLFDDGIEVLETLRDNPILDFPTYW